MSDDSPRPDGDSGVYQYLEELDAERRAHVVRLQRLMWFYSMAFLVFVVGLSISVLGALHR